MAKKIALFMGQVIQFYQNDMVTAITDSAEGLGYVVDVFSDFGSYGENYLHAEGEKNIINLPRLDNYDGIILGSDTYDIKGMYEKLAQKIIEEANCPVISLRYEDKRFYNVLIDDYGAMRDMVEHFVTTHGFKRICFMTGRMELLDAQRRLQAYQDTMKKYKIPVTEHMVFEGDYWKYKGEDAVTWFLQEGDLPEAIVCANDYMAVSVFEALRKRGYNVPEDISVSGFDNIDEAKYSDPPIASVDVPVEAMAQMAVQTIDRILKGWSSEQYIYVPVKGSYQGTCGCRTKNRERRVAELYTRTQYLQHAIQRMSYMNVDFENCNTMEELLHTAFVYSYFFAYDTMYLCLNDDSEQQSDELSAAETYTDKVYLKAIMSRSLGFTLCDEVFDRAELLPAKYKDTEATNYFFPIHYKNQCLGYLVLQSEKIDNLREMFPAWALNVGSFIDKMRMYQQNKELMGFREQSLRDELTGLYNRRMMEKTLKAKGRMAYANKGGFCIVNVDMDGLKRINDIYGHREGDDALKAFAEILKAVERENVVCARVGGDEFTVCVTTRDEEEVQALIADIKRRIDVFNETSGEPFYMSASIGYAFYQQGKDLTDCIERADHSMYTNKAKRKSSGNYQGGEPKVIPNEPAMLLSYINLKLRDNYKTLDALCEDLNLDKNMLMDKLATIDYRYNEENNKFV